MFSKNDPLLISDILVRGQIQTNVHKATYRKKITLSKHERGNFSQVTN